MCEICCIFSCHTNCNVCSICIITAGDEVVRLWHRQGILSMRKVWKYQFDECEKKM